MPSTPKDVSDLIEREPVLQTTLSRGMINASGAARWLKQEYDLDLEVESIARRVREFEPEESPREWREGREAVEDGAHHIRSDMALLIIRRSGKSQERLAQILGNLDEPKMHAVRIEPTRRYFQVVIEGELKEEFERQLGRPPLEDVRDGLVEVSVVTDQPEGSPSPALSATLQELHQRNVAVPFATSGPAGITVLVPDSVRFEAHEIIEDLTGYADGG